MHMTSFNSSSAFPMLNLPADLLEYLILPLAGAAGSGAIRSTSKLLRDLFDKKNTYLVIRGPAQSDSSVSGMTPSAVINKTTLIKTLLHRTTHLQFLQIKQSAVDTFYPAEGTLLEFPRYESIQKIELTCCDSFFGHRAGLSYIVMSCPNLQSLTLNKYGGDMQNFMASLSTACSKLQHIHIRWNNLTSLSIIALSGLKRLDLGHCRILRSVQTLTACSLLESFTLSVPPTFDIGSICALAQSLTHLDLSFHTNPYWIADQLSIEPLRGLSSLTRLAFSTAQHDNAFARTKLSLTPLASLKVLALTHCTINDFSPLHGCDSLRVLDLALCSIDRGRGMASLVGCTQLKSLQLTIVDSIGGNAPDLTTEPIVDSGPSETGALSVLRGCGTRVKVFAYSDLKPC